MSELERDCALSGTSSAHHLSTRTPFLDFNCFLLVVTNAPYGGLPESGFKPKPKESA